MPRWRLQHRDEHRLHDGVSGRRLAGAVARMAHDVVCGWRRHPRRSRSPCPSSLVRRNPESIGLLPDGEPRTPNSEPSNPDWELGPRRLYPARSHFDRRVLDIRYWRALYGLVASGIGLFNESILAEQGFGAKVYYQTLVVTAMTGLAGNFVGGWLARFVPLNRLMAISAPGARGGPAGSSSCPHDQQWPWSGRR